MSYATVEQMTQRYGSKLYEYCDVDDGADLSANEQLAQAISEADSEVDSYLRAQYSLPLAEVPEVIVGAACTIARYNLIAATRIDIMSEEIENTHSKALKFLRDLAAGNSRLDISDAAVAQSTSRATVVGSAVSGSSPVNQSWFEGY